MQIDLLTKPAYDLAALRDQFEVSQRGLVYLNHAGMSPLPIPVKNAMISAIEQMASDGSLAYNRIFDQTVPPLLEKTGQLLGCDPNEVAFVESTSMGINLIANSLPLKAGDNILLCDTEFPSNVYPWLNLGRKGIETIEVPTRSGGLSTEGLEEYRNAHTRVVAVSAVQFFSGRREDLTLIGQYCKDHGLWFVVDAMQAAGIIPINMLKMGIHALAAGGQKALLGPPGQGITAIRSELVEQMSPVFAGPLSVHDWEHWLKYDLRFLPNARRFDMGTSNLAGLAGLLAAVTLILELGTANIADWVTHLSDVVIADLEMLGYRVITPQPPDDHAHIVTFAVDRNPSELVAGFQQHGIILRAHEDALGNPYLRISSHAYNSVEDVQRVGKVLEELNYE